MTDPKSKIETRTNLKRKNLETVSSENDYLERIILKRKNFENEAWGQKTRGNNLRPRGAIWITQSAAYST